MIHFSKMHGLGNDIVVVDATSHSVSFEKKQLQQLSNRYTGIGFDQLIVIEPSKKANFACRIFNADGSEAEQCGNGMRCVARFIHETGLHSGLMLTLETRAGIITTVIHSYDHIAVTMGIPAVLKETLPFDIESLMMPTRVSMGNPHLILQVACLNEYPVADMGQRLATHKFFPEGVNVGFMEIVNREHIRLQTFERGVGKTLACGSNACAAVAAGIYQGLLATNVRVELSLGSLQIEWPEKDSVMQMTGPAVSVFAGSLN